METAVIKWLVLASLLLPGIANPHLAMAEEYITLVLRDAYLVAEYEVLGTRQVTEDTPTGTEQVTEEIRRLTALRIVSKNPQISDSRSRAMAVIVVNGQVIELEHNMRRRFTKVRFNQSGEFWPTQWSMRWSRLGHVRQDQLLQADR